MASDSKVYFFTFYRTIMTTSNSNPKFYHLVCANSFTDLYWDKRFKPETTYAEFVALAIVADIRHVIVTDSADGPSGQEVLDYINAKGGGATVPVPEWLGLYAMEKYCWSLEAVVEAAEYLEKHLPNYYSRQDVADVEDLYVAIESAEEADRDVPPGIEAEYFERMYNLLKEAGHASGV